MADAPALTYREIKTRLRPKSSQALGELTARTGLSEADVVNRAIQIYALLTAEQADGAHIIVHKEGEAHVLTWS
ncbi:hypothetical protein [Nonomuraea wenchangensis]|uniref:hypothetical protein n=1 Tax=Nonomuraea wenchangensis TaxID=568860 RepID=UPI00332A8B84